MADDRWPNQYQFEVLAQYGVVRKTWRALGRVFPSWDEFVSAVLSDVNPVGMVAEKRGISWNTADEVVKIVFQMFDTTYEEVVSRRAPSPEEDSQWYDNEFLRDKVERRAINRLRSRFGTWEQFKSDYFTWSDPELELMSIPWIGKRFATQIIHAMSQVPAPPTPSAAVMGSREEIQLEAMNQRVSALEIALELGAGKAEALEHLSTGRDEQIAALKRQIEELRAHQMLPQQHDGTAKQIVVHSLSVGTIFWLTCAMVAVIFVWRFAP